MKINIETKISSNYKNEEINIVIKTSEMCQEVENIIEKIQDTSNKIKVVTGRENNNITLVPYTIIFLAILLIQRYFLKKRVNELNKIIEK